MEIRLQNFRSEGKASANIWRQEQAWLLKNRKISVAAITEVDSHVPTPTLGSKRWEGLLCLRS